MRIYMKIKCNHCFVWSKKKTHLVTACVYCGDVALVYKVYEESDRKLIEESYENYKYIHDKYGCIAKPWNYDAMKQQAYRKLAKL